MAASETPVTDVTQTRKKRSIGDKLILFGDESAPPVRFVLMTAFCLEAEVEFSEVDLFKEEHKMDFYKKMNPLQKVPVLVTHDQILIDSHVIALYLCRKLDAKNKLYPNDDLGKAKVDQMLFYNSSTLFPIYNENMTDYIDGCPANKDVIKKWYKALDFLEKRLNCQPFLAGDIMTMCDICIAATVTSMLCIAPLANHHVQLKQWLSEFEDQPFFEINNRGIKRLMKYVKAADNQEFDVGL